METGGFAVVVVVIEWIPATPYYSAVFVVLTVTRIIKSVVIGQAPVTLEVGEEYPREKHKQTKGMNPRA